MSPEIAQAFQDGLRTSIRVLEEDAALAMHSALWSAHKALHDTARKLREMINHDIQPPPVTYEQRLACAVDTIQAITDHARDGGSYRKLIYDRLGFDVDAYRPLWEAGGMEISNEFVVTEADPGDFELASRLLKGAWPKNGSSTIEIVGGQEPWVTICESAYRIQSLSTALQAEQEKRRRIEAELLFGWADYHLDT